MLSDSFLFTRPSSVTNSGVTVSCRRIRFSCSKPKSIWEKDDEFIGDPPHEFQGWYSVYSSDLSTIKIIKSFSSKFNDI